MSLATERKQIEVGRPSAESLQTSLNNMILRLDSLYSVSVADKNGLVLAAAASASAPAAALPTLQAAGDTGGSVSSPRAGGSAFAPSATAAGVLTVSGPSVDSMVLAFLASTEQASKLFAGSSTTITTTLSSHVIVQHLRAPLVVTLTAGHAANRGALGDALDALCTKLEWLRARVAEDDKDLEADGEH